LIGDRALPISGSIAVDQLRDWFTARVAPLVAKCSIAEIRRSTGLSTRYVIMIRQGLVPHPRHYPALAALVGIEVPKPLLERPGYGIPPNGRIAENYLE
jgi:hypothetical protein